MKEKLKHGYKKSKVPNIRSLLTFLFIKTVLDSPVCDLHHSKSYFQHRPFTIIVSEHITNLRIVDR